LVPTQAAFIEAALEHGFPASDDVNAPDAVGVGKMAMNKLGRLRISTALGYLSAARYRDNLTIRSDTTVDRVVIDNGRAVGVETASGDRVAARIVVVSSGAIHTPGVLVRSGVGDPEELARLGIEPVAKVPGVGANLSDHPALAVMLRPKFPEFCAPELPLVQTICRYTSEESDTPLDVNIELITRAMGRDGTPLFMLAPSLEQVDGRGRVRQTSADPDSMPTIETRFGENDRDVRRHVTALEDAITLTRLAPLQEFIDDVVFPDTGRGSRAELEHVARRVSASGYHPCGTAKMGPVDDPTAVVDQFGRCHAVEQLVVADASIMPTVPRANINLSSIMIGEMVGEWLRTEPGRYGL
jgi:choline dehydrogenase